MKRPFFFFFLSFLSFNIVAQNFTNKADSDPAATAILESMKKKYESYESLKADFTLSFEMPEEPTQTQQGTLIQFGEKYRLELDERTLVSDGKSVWLYTANNKEVLINDAEEESEPGTISSPQDLLKAYEWDDYIYVLSNELSEKGRVIQQIEFKPTTRDSDYSKIRLTVDKKSLDIIRIKSFSKDGTRYTIDIDKLSPNTLVGANTFTFTKKECPDCHFEDLRID